MSLGGCGGQLLYWQKAIKPESGFVSLCRSPEIDLPAVVSLPVPCSSDKGSPARKARISNFDETSLLKV